MNIKNNWTYKDPIPNDYFDPYYVIWLKENYILICYVLDSHKGGDEYKYTWEEFIKEKDKIIKRYHITEEVINEIIQTIEKINSASTEERQKIIKELT
jgi:hypothetical protein